MGFIGLGVIERLGFIGLSRAVGIRGVLTVALRVSSTIYRVIGFIKGLGL